jgi:hypothetical protein
MITICSGICYCVALLRLTIYTAQNEVMKRSHNTEVWLYVITKTGCKPYRNRGLRVRVYVHKQSLYRVTNSVGHVSTAVLDLLPSISL